MIRRPERAAPTAASSRAELLAVGALIVGFIAVVLWFDRVDFYHRHFFDAGAIVAADNAMRIVFVGIFAWLIYAPGAGIAALIMSPAERAALSAAERAVLGFGIGVGIWHVVMLILGVLDLYYRSVIVGLCLVVLAASARHFARIVVAGCDAIAVRFGELRRGRAPPQTVGAILVAVIAAWLLLRRGLYPGGGGDYYTHYFYYYLEVLKNHGLAPNDVWYHYYYSKGSGLAFLGMLLTDPEAPALTTFPCVACAAIAMTTLAERMAPQSLWPAAGALVYLLFYLLNPNGSGEGEFQKDHEEIAALVVLTVWALCMERCGPPRPFRVMAAASGIAAAIVTQVVGILLGLFTGLLSAWSMVRRRWSDVGGYGLVGAAIAGAVLAMFVLSYVQTGMASDQELRLMLSFANFGRLDRWGVIPVLIAGVWIRDNYLALEPPFGWGAFKELGQFMRAGTLWPFLAGPVIAAVILRVSDRFAGGRLTLSPDAAAASFAAATAARLAVLLGFLAVIALAMGRAQSVSFVRLSTFFIPLGAMFGIAGSVWALTRQIGRRRDWWAWTVLPIALLVVVIMEWQTSAHWTRRIAADTANALRFLSGQWSLAEAYAHAESRYAFGGINPSALAAAQQLPYGTPIWSTNVDSYCMVPGCLIESVMSFKMSGRLDEILGGDPDLAKRRLQEAGLNYFLFDKNYQIIDLLPFGRLFAPETIGLYLGVKWSDGSTFLLTWAGPQSRPIGPDFLDAYTHRLAEADPTHWFKFDELVPLIATITPRMRSVTEWGAAQNLLSWR
jgi:predicted nucleic acid-binding protein